MNLMQELAQFLAPKFKELYNGAKMVGNSKLLDGKSLDDILGMVGSGGDGSGGGDCSQIFYGFKVSNNHLIETKETNGNVSVDDFLGYAVLCKGEFYIQDGHLKVKI